MQTRMLSGTGFEAGAEEAEIVLNPATGETIRELPEASAEQIDRAVAAAGKAFQSWRRTTPAERSNALLKLADRIEAEGADFARLEALNCGKPYHSVLGAEIPAVFAVLRFFAAPPPSLHGSPPGQSTRGHPSLPPPAPPRRGAP